MQIRLVWPRLMEATEITKPTTFFWLECDPEEAIEVLRSSKAEGTTYLNYAFAIKGAIDFLREHPEHKSDDFLNEGKVFMMISSDGKILIDESQTMPLDPMWDPYGPPLAKIDAIQLTEVSELFEIGDYIFGMYPWLSDQFEWDDIPSRANFFKLAQIGIEKYYGKLPETEKEGLEANDDRLAMAIFTFMDSPLGEYRQNWQREGGRIPADLVYELGRQYKARGKLDWWNYEEKYPFQFQILRADEMPLYEIYQRRARADDNLEKILWATDTHRNLVIEIVKNYSDDELCEMLLLAWSDLQQQGMRYLELLKPILIVLSERIKPVQSGDADSEWNHYSELHNNHVHFSRDLEDSEGDMDWAQVVKSAEATSQRIHSNCRTFSSRDCSSRLFKLVGYVRAYEAFVWQFDVKRLFEQGGKHFSSVIDSAIATIHLQSLYWHDDENKSNFRQDHDWEAIPETVLEVVELLEAEYLLGNPNDQSLQAKSNFIEWQVGKFQKMRSNEIGRVVALANLAIDYEETFKDLQSSLNTSPTSSNAFAMELALLELSQSEWEWFEATVKKRVNEQL